MTKRIVINDYSCIANGGEYYTIAINTRQGTILDSIITVKKKLHARAIVNGYLHMYHGIEVHPGSLDTWIALNLETGE